MGLCTDWTEAGQANNTETNAIMIFFSAMTIILDLKYNYCHGFVLTKGKYEAFFPRRCIYYLPGCTDVVRDQACQRRCGKWPVVWPQVRHSLQRQILRTESWSPDDTLWQGHPCHRRERRQSRFHIWETDSSSVKRPWWDATTSF